MLQGPFTPVVHQPARTVANGHETTSGLIPSVAGISERRRTAATPPLRLHTAEVAGSKSASPTSKKSPFAGKTGILECVGAPASTLLTTVDDSWDSNRRVSPLRHPCPVRRETASKRTSCDYVRFRRRPIMRSSTFDRMRRFPVLTEAYPS